MGKGRATVLGLWSMWGRVLLVSSDRHNCDLYTHSSYQAHTPVSALGLQLGGCPDHILTKAFPKLLI